MTQPTFDIETFANALKAEVTPPWISDCLKTTYEQARAAVAVTGGAGQALNNQSTESFLNIQEKGEPNSLNLWFTQGSTPDKVSTFSVSMVMQGRDQLSLHDATLNDAYELAQLRATRSVLAKVLASSLHDFVVSPLHC